FKSDFQKSDDQLNQLGKDLALAVRTAGKSNDAALSAKFDSFSTRARKLASDFGGLKPPSKVKANVTKLRSALTTIADDMKAVATAVRTHNAKHRVGHRSERGQRLVAVLSDIEVNLRERLGPDSAVRVDQERDLNAVSREERQSLEQ